MHKLYHTVITRKRLAGIEECFCPAAAEAAELLLFENSLL